MGILIQYDLRLILNISQYGVIQHLSEKLEEPWRQILPGILLLDPSWHVARALTTFS